ncbi:putative 12-oxophytodienoate reductase [Rosa chinensis]|uniref:Putative 12-oxophytodienoate reductase n=1 Tax=Rosa chinensis TaxID=74649 RepID=A0A2P6PFD5_ROSCH|nr:putative 12-oxophytodienoate reductase [Rosa chinensis]
MKDQVNDRTDQYGGSLENRCRFALEIIEAVVNKQEQIKLELDYLHLPTIWNQGIQTLEALGLYMVQSLNKYGILYCHVIEPRMKEAAVKSESADSLLPTRKAFNGTFIAASSFDREDGNNAVAEGCADLIAYDRWFLSNPDLPKKQV